MYIVSINWTGHKLKHSWFFHLLTIQFNFHVSILNTQEYNEAQGLELLLI
jgi:hypothetical protein